MPAPIAPLIGFVLGVAFAWAASDELSRRPSSVTGPPLVLVALFSLLVFGPITLFFLSLAPDWAYAYLIDTDKIPRVADLVLVLVNVASVPLGFGAAARQASLRNFGAVVAIAAIPAALAAAFLAATLRRLSVNATYRQFQDDFGTHSIAGTPLGYGLLWMLLVLVAATLWTAHCLHASSRVARKTSVGRTPTQRSQET
jgi:hypothetical protein